MKININFLANHVNKLRDFILDLVFPIECLGCGREGAWLCRGCFQKIKFKQTRCCLHCKKKNKLGQFCFTCQPYYSLNGIWIACDYKEQIISKLIKNLKYCFVQDIVKDLGKLLILFLQDLINKNWIGKADLVNRADRCKFGQVNAAPNILFNFSQNLIIPVPLSGKRKRWRGFNQAEAISRVIARYFNLDLSVSRLIRIKHKKPQTKLGEIERKNNVVGCFDWRGSDLAGKNIILIDDVVTTGATLNECAKVLKQNGAGDVWGLVLAKG